MTGSAPHALVVDNNPVLLKAISALVDREGCLVHTAQNGLQALQLLRDQPIDIVFTDLVMPLVSGEQLCRILSSTDEFKDIFVVVVSAIPVADAMRLMAVITCDLCIVKDELPLLRDHIRQALTHYRRQDRATGMVLAPGGASVIGVADTKGIAGEILDEKMHREEIVACLSEGVIELSDAGLIVDINQAALEILELRVADAIGVDIAALEWGEQRSNIEDWRDRELVGKAMGTLVLGEQQPIKRLGRVLTMTLTPVSGNSYFGICIIRDITRQYCAEAYRRNIDQALRLAKKMDALSGMAGGVAHDFNNLLAVICGAIEVATLALGDGDSGKVQDNLEQARLATQTAVELVRKISQSSAYGIIEREPADIRPVIHQATATRMGVRAAEIVYEEAGETLMVTIDRAQIIAALQHLLDNSIEAGADTLRISVRPEVFTEPAVFSGHYIPAGSYVRVELSDNGCGIDRQALQRIFDPYYSTKQRGVAKGMGLGLTVVYSIIRNHGGYIVVDSQPGCGAAVSLYLPQFDIEGPAATCPHQPIGGSVLLVEQDRHIRDLAVAMLHYLGMEVVVAETPATALVTYRQGIDHGVVFRAALLNLPMEKITDAIQVCRSLREADPDLQIIAVSGSPLLSEMRECRRYGFSNALAKPYTVDDLRNIFAGAHPRPSRS